MPLNNLRQADIPEGASPIPEMPGTAPGLICTLGAKVIYAVPGVPHEMQTMVAASVLPDLQRRAGVGAVIQSRVLRTWGHTESGLAELLAARIEELDLIGNPTLAFQASGIEGIKVRITAKAPDPAAANAILMDEEARLRAVLGDYVFGVDDQTMEAVVVDLLNRRGLSLAVAESVTGGLATCRLTAVPGAGEVVRGGLVAYDSEIKFELLGVPRGPVVTCEAAAAMAAGVRRLLGADVGLATRLPPTAWRMSVPIYSGLEQVGYATSGAWSPLLKKYITLAHLRSPWARPGTPLDIEVTVEHRRRRAEARVVKKPFFDPERKRA